MIIETIILSKCIFYSECFTPFLQDLVSFFQGKRLCKIAISFKISVGFRPVNLVLQLEENYRRCILSLVPLFKEILHCFDFFSAIRPLFLQILQDNHFSVRSCKITIFMPESWRITVFFCKILAESCKITIRRSRLEWPVIIFAIIV